MARPDPAISLRVPARARRLAPDRLVDPERPRLRLVVTKGRLGVELEEPFALGPLRVSELGLVLPEVRFPVELSGGVTAFRNKRGSLERLVVSLPAASFQRWGAARLARVLDDEVVQFIAAPLEDGWLVGLCGHHSALAFEVLLAPLSGDLRLIPTAARGLGLSVPPQALAVNVLGALLKPAGRKVGGAVIIEEAAAMVSKQLLPLAGMRAASVGGLQWTELRFDVAEVAVEAMADAPPAVATPRVASAVELAALVAESEQALVAGNLDEARRGYLAALASAPRHQELTRRLAEVDVVVGERAEAALSTLSSALSPMDAGALGAQLLAATGDRDGAGAAMRRAAEQEPYGSLAALCWLEVAKLEPEPEQAAAALDEAIARAPGLATIRWQRFEQRLRAGQLQEAQADVEHLEAAATSAHQRHGIMRRAADRWLEQRALDEAVEAYERALRYAPDSITAVAGLARSLAAVGHRRRALELSSRAVALAERSRQPAHGITIELAQLLVEVADDRPAAISRIRRVPGFVAATFEARLLEARWRAELGDLSGASEALARLGDAIDGAAGGLVEAPAPPADVDRAPYAGLWGPEDGSEGLEPPRYGSGRDARLAIAMFCEEGARLEELDRGDLRAARRLLGQALRLAPHRRSIQASFRRVAAEIDPPPSTKRSDAPGPAASYAAPRSDPAPGSTASPFRPSPSARAPAMGAGSTSGAASDETGPSTGHQPVAATAASDDEVSTRRLGSEAGPGPSALTQGEDDRGDEQALPAAAVAALLAPALGDQLAALGEEPSDEDEVTLELRAEQLSERLRADPNDALAVAELAALLELLGRDHELLALLSARIDEVSGAEREALVGQRRAVLGRLIGAASEAGRDEEASLYQLMLDRND